MRPSDRVATLATGAMLLTLMGAGFCGLGLQVLSLWSWLEAVLLPTVILLAFGADALRAARGLRAAEPEATPDQLAQLQRRRMVNLRIVALAVLVVLFTVQILAYSNRSAWLVPAVALIVGGALLAGRAWRTGGPIVAATLALLPVSGTRRDVFTLIAAGVILWIGAVGRLFAARRVTFSARQRL